MSSPSVAHVRFPVADIVLLHGTTQSPAGWRPLGNALRGRGHRVHATDLPSGAFSAEEYAALVQEQLPTGVTRPVVVAHSGAGLLLPAVAKRVGASHQVWLAAAIPDPNRSLMEEVATETEAIFNQEWLGQDPVDDAVLATYFLFHDCDLVTLRWALGTLRRFLPERVYREPVALTPEIPSTAVVATGDRTLQPVWSLRAARVRLGIEAVTIDSGHCPHVSHPTEVAAMIDAVSPR